MSNILSNDEAARYVRRSPSFMNKRRCTGGGPTFVRIGRRIGYMIEDLDEWLHSQRRRSTSDLGNQQQNR